jgi:hypothetical protein
LDVAHEPLLEIFTVAAFEGEFVVVDDGAAHGLSGGTLKMVPFLPASPGAPRRAFQRASFSARQHSQRTPLGNELYWQLGVGWLEIRRLRYLSRLRPCWTTMLSIPGAFMNCEPAIPGNVLRRWRPCSRSQRQ